MDSEGDSYAWGTRRRRLLEQGFDGLVGGSVFLSTADLVGIRGFFFFLVVV
jgi:hypothetical protein